MIRQHHFFATFVGIMISFFNSLVGYDPLKYRKLSDESKTKFFIRLIYKDPSVGGVCGTNLFRFILNRFPDPVCESLSWWKLLYQTSRERIIRELAIEVGNPFIGRITDQTLTMILEDPTTINIAGGLSPEKPKKIKFMRDY